MGGVLIQRGTDLRRGGANLRGYDTKRLALYLTTVFAHVLVDLVYKSTPSFWGKKLDF